MRPLFGESADIKKLVQSIGDICRTLKLIFVVPVARGWIAGDLQKIGQNLRPQGPWPVRNQGWASARSEFCRGQMSARP